MDPASGTEVREVVLGGLTNRIAMSPGGIAIVTNDQCMGEIEDLISRERFSKVAHVLRGGVEWYESSLAAICAFPSRPISPSASRAGWS